MKVNFPQELFVCKEGDRGEEYLSNYDTPELALEGTPIGKVTPVAVYQLVRVERLTVKIG